MKKFEWYFLCYYTTKRTVWYIFKNLLSKKFLLYRLKFLDEMYFNKYNEKICLVFEYQDPQYYYHNSLYYQENESLETLR